MNSATFQPLEQEIREAFADAQRPSGPFLRAGLDHDPYLVELEASYAMQDEPPDVGFLRSHVHNGEYQRPETYRWFWRSLLLASLADGEYFSALYGLRPNPCTVLMGSPDRSRELGRTLTRPQRVAIAHILHDRLESSSDYLHRSLAAQAIAWEWGDAPEANEAAARFRAAARSYQRPAAAEPRDEELIQQIERAFAETPEPKGPLTQHVCEECAEYALELAGASWRTLTPEFMSLRSAFLSLATAEAFRYVLPAALIHSVLGHGWDMSPEFHLVNALLEPSTYREKCRETARTFAPGERVAIVAYLRRQAARHPSDRDAIEAAIREVWQV